MVENGDRILDGIELVPLGFAGDLVHGICQLVMRGWHGIDNSE